ncbi:MAG: hypothetical protein KHX03_09740 [Clostridium sp.]|nr:hypothetical protein [Clostridium sp.]
MGNMLVATDIKRFFKSKFGTVTILLSLFCLSIYFMEFYQMHEMMKIRKAIHHRYFNSVRTTEQLYGIEINTLNGEIKPVYQSPYKR